MSVQVLHLQMRWILCAFVALALFSTGCTPDAHTEARDHVGHVKIRLNGPSTGTTPHYLAYSADLPASIAQGADFLWTDNGRWIGDEPRGVKILESPAPHRISVLITTRDNVEYRGSAMVQVLERGPASTQRLAQIP